MDLALLLPVLLFSVVVHEYAHGWVALRQGDDTAYKLGRLTLNPLPHIDPLGSVIVPALLWASNAGFLFGWAKPVPVMPPNFRNYRRGDILVSLAGIVANLILALGFTLLLFVAVALVRGAPDAGGVGELLARVAHYGILINLILAFFNLLPVPPLDGSHVMYHLLPPRLGARYRELGRFGILIVFGIMILAPGAFRLVLSPVLLVHGFLVDFAASTR
jgi:Zn-dependent protease